MKYKSKSQRKAVMASIKHRSLSQDRHRRADIILPKGMNKTGINMRRADVNHFDTKDRYTYKSTTKVHKGKSGGLYVIRNGKRRYLST